MRTNLAMLLFTLLGFCISTNAYCQNYSITITITGFHNNNGKAILYMFNSEAGYPQDRSKAFRISTGIISKNTCSITLTEIPKGTYAIGCFHDENDNGKMDTNLVGIPTEGVGASNNAKGFMGPPKFTDAKFMVENNVAISITVTH